MPVAGPGIDETYGEMIDLVNDKRILNKKHKIEYFFVGFSSLNQKARMVAHHKNI